MCNITLCSARSDRHLVRLLPKGGHESLFALFPILPGCCFPASACYRRRANSHAPRPGHDPSGAVIPWRLHLAHRRRCANLQTKSSAGGEYAFRSLAPGSYTVSVTAEGFAPLTIPNVTLTAGQSKALNLPLTIEVENQKSRSKATYNPSASVPTRTPAPSSSRAAISTRSPTIPTNCRMNCRRSPARRRTQWRPNLHRRLRRRPDSAQILHPRSSRQSKSLLRRIRSHGLRTHRDHHQARLAKLQGSIGGYGIDSALNTANPFLAQQAQLLPYGVLRQCQRAHLQNLLILLSRPATSSARTRPSSTPSIRKIQCQHHRGRFPARCTYLTPSARASTSKSARSNMFISVREAIHPSTRSRAAASARSILPEQANKRHNHVQRAADRRHMDHQLASPHELRFACGSHSHRPDARIRSLLPSPCRAHSPTAAAASGASQNHADQSSCSRTTWTATAAGTHSASARASAPNRDANYSQCGVNGSYYFSSVANYLAQTPTQYSATVITNPLARACSSTARSSCRTTGAGNQIS